MQSPSCLRLFVQLRPAGGFACRLHGRQQKRDQDADDGDDHQQLDERKTRSLGLHEGYLTMGYR